MSDTRLRDCLSPRYRPLIMRQSIVLLSAIVTAAVVGGVAAVILAFVVA
jgi:hypothetical protein